MEHMLLADGSLRPRGARLGRQADGSLPDLRRIPADENNFRKFAAPYGRGHDVGL